MRRTRMKITGYLALFLAAMAMVGLSGKVQAVKAEQEQVAVDILSSQFGAISYIMPFALADMINKYSPWLRATVREQPAGDTANVRILAEKPERRKNTIIFASTPTAYQSMLGTGPFKAKYTPMAVAQFFPVCGSFVSTDLGIKKGDGLIGKKIAVGTRMSVMAYVPEAIFKYGWNILNKVKFLYLGWQGSKDTVLSGQADVGFIGAIVVGSKFIGNPVARDFIAGARKINWIDTPPEVLARAARGSGLPIVSFTVPAGSLGKKQPNIHYSWGFQNGLWAAPELDDKIVYEVCRIMSEHAKEFVKYHAAGRAITFDAGAKFQIPAKDYHPGAVKYYKEKGFQIGLSK